MSMQLEKLCSTFLEHHFGRTTKIVGSCLFASIWITMPGIQKTTKLSTSQITKSLQILLKFGLVKYRPCKDRETTAEFALQPSHILFMIRFPRFVHLILGRFGEFGASLVGDLLMEGTETASNLIAKSLANVDGMTDLDAATGLRTTFIEMVNAKFLIRAAAPTTESAVPVLETDATKLFLLPEINVTGVVDRKEKKKVTLEDDAIFWQVNVERMHQEFRDDMLISAVERRIDASAGECFRLMIECAYERTDPWKKVSASICMGEIRRKCEKKSKNEKLKTHVVDYVSVIESDTLEFITKIGELDGGQYVINFQKIFIELAWNCVEQCVSQKFDKKAGRIFRVIRLRKYIEQESLQREIMVSPKETKALTFKLLEENYIHSHPIRKTGGGGAGQPKSFYLFHIDFTHLVAMITDNCYKAMYNLITKTALITETNKRLVIKSQYIESLIENTRAEGQVKAEQQKQAGEPVTAMEEAEAQVTILMEDITPPEREILEKVRLRLKTVASAEIVMDETLFVLQMYQFYINLP